MVNTEAVAAKRSRAHTQYRTKSGLLVPGVTSVLGVLAKPALVPWANGLGLQGINVNQYVDVLAIIGTYAHEMILKHLKNEKFDPADRPADLIDKAENCYLSFLAWESKHKLVPMICEEPLVHDVLLYGGTPDFAGMVDGVPTVLDFKTSKAIYPEHFYQVAAYEELLRDNNITKKDGIKELRILQIGRDETEGFSERVVTEWAKEWSIFEHALAIYRLQHSKK